MRILLAVTALVLAAGTAVAQAPMYSSNIAPPPTNDEARAPRGPRAHGISPMLASEAILTAISTCLGNGYKVTGLITDAAGVPVGLLSGEEAAAITQRVAMGKAQSVLRYKMTSGEAAAKAAADPAFAKEVAADPLIVVPRQGAIPVMAGGDLIGAFAVSGAPGGDKDEVCARAGLAKIQARIK